MKAYCNSTGDFCGRDYRLEKTMIIIFGVLQGILLIASSVGIVVIFRLNIDMCDLIEAGVMCSLQLGAATNLARLLQVCQHPRWSVWLTYVVTIMIIPDNIPMSFFGETNHISKLPLLAPLAIASLLCVTVSHLRLKSHKTSGLQRPDKKMLRLFTAFIITNLFSAAIQLSGGLLLALAALGKDKFRVQVRQSVLLACACTHVFVCLATCSGSTKGCFSRIRASLRSRPSSMATERNMENGSMSLVTLQTSHSSSKGIEG